MPQPEAGVEKPQPMVVLHDCRMAGVVSHEKTCTYESARAIDKKGWQNLQSLARADTVAEEIRQKGSKPLYCNSKKGNREPDRE